jgi:hypothetical protein
MKSGKCFYCEKDATYFDIVMDNEDYIVADVCMGHVAVGLSS